MIAVVQRVSGASVVVDGQIVAAIGHGLLVFLGIGLADTIDNSEQLAAKVVNLRIFADDAGKMNRSVRDQAGEILIVSQFTLCGDTAKSNRPSFSRAAPAEQARTLYEDFVQRCKSTGLPVQTGVFQAKMEVQLTNDGPVTLICRSENN